MKFYTEVLGWYLIMEPTEIVEDDSAIGEMCTDVFGAGWGSFRIAHLSTGDRIASNSSSSPTRKIQMTTLSTGKPVYSTSASRIPMSRSWPRRLSPPAAKSA